MCGIIFTKSDHPATTNLLTEFQYLAQRERGVEGFGFAYVDENNQVQIKRAEHEHEILDLLTQIDSKEILFHHRKPTSTKNTIQQTHPFHIKRGNKNYYVIHNGSVLNAEELKEDHHDPLNIPYTTLTKANTFNDSEALAIEFALYLSGEIEKPRFRGYAAVIIIEADENNHPQKLYAYHNSLNKPLKQVLSEDFEMFSSLAGDEQMPIDTLYEYDFATLNFLKETKLITPITKSPYTGYRTTPVSQTYACKSCSVGTVKNINDICDACDEYYQNLSAKENEVITFKQGYVPQCV
jgi:predicted glutamine amidotransferase